MRAIHLALLVSCTLPLSACQTVSFKRQTGTSFTKHDQWHTSMLYGLVEVSSPVEPAEICENAEWHEVRTQETLGTAVMSASLGMILDPVGVEVICSSQVSKTP